MNHCRIATPHDIEIIAHLHTLSWQTAYRGILSDDYLDHHVRADRMEVWTKRLNAPADNQIIFLQEMDGTAVGFVCAYGSSADEFGTFIDNLHVLPGFKGKGIGRALMSQVSQWSREHFHQPKLYLKVLKDNYPARRFYDKVGGRPQALFSETMPGGAVTDVYRYVWEEFAF